MDMGDPNATLVPGDAAVLDYAYALEAPMEELARCAGLGASGEGMEAWRQKKRTRLAGYALRRRVIRAHSSLLPTQGRPLAAAP